MTSTEVEFAVIVPCFNVADTLAEQLEALSAQDWDRSWEVIVVDNGSTDATPDLAKEYASRTDRIRVLRAIAGQSVAYARNAGARATSARTIAFCDGDDIVRPGWVAAMGNALRSHDLVSGRIDATRINEPWLASTRPNNAPDRLPTFGEVEFARGCCSGMTRALWERLGGYDEQFCGLEDIEFSIRAAAAGARVHLVADAIVDYRYRSGIGHLWRQGFFYGRGISELRRRAKEFGLQGPPRSQAFKSLLWLVAKLPTLTQRSGRYAWIWVVAHRLGALRGALDRHL